MPWIDRPGWTVTTMQLPDDVLALVKAEAARRGMSKNAALVALLREHAAAARQKKETRSLAAARQGGTPPDTERISG